MEDTYTSAYAPFTKKRRPDKVTSNISVAATTYASCPIAHILQLRESNGSYHFSYQITLAHPRFVRDVSIEAQEIYKLINLRDAMIYNLKFLDRASKITTDLNASETIQLLTKSNFHNNSASLTGNGVETSAISFDSCSSEKGFHESVANALALSIKDTESWKNKVIADGIKVPLTYESVDQTIKATQSWIDVLTSKPVLHNFYNNIYDLIDKADNTL